MSQGFIGNQCFNCGRVTFSLRPAPACVYCGDLQLNSWLLPERDQRRYRLRLLSGRRRTLRPGHRRKTLR